MCLLACVMLDAHALKGASPAGTDISGSWVVNTTASDDGEAMLANRMEDLRKQQRREQERLRRRMQEDPTAWMPQFSPPELTPQQRAAMEERERNRRRMLGLTKQLEIAQDPQGSKVTIVTDFETRRFDAGTRTQVSLPQGELADSESGWDGEWFVIERKARNGPRITERFRLVKKTGQLEMRVAISGNSMLAGMKLRRVFDRAPKEAQVKPSGEVMGPVR
jgi:hypothetical protein